MLFLQLLEFVGFPFRRGLMKQTPLRRLKEQDKRRYLAYRESNFETLRYRFV